MRDNYKDYVGLCHFLLNFLWNYNIFFVSLYPVI